MGVLDKPAEAPTRSHHKKPAVYVRGSGKSMYDFFQKPPKPGRPAASGMPPKKRGRPSASTSTTQAGAEQSVDDAEAATPSPVAEAATPAPRALTSSGAHASSGASSSSGAWNSAVSGKRAAAELLGVQLKRTNWSHGEPLERMTKAVADWDAKTGPHLEQETKMPLSRYAGLVGIEYQSLNKYACKDLGKRQKLGSGGDKKSLFDGDEAQFAVDVIRRFDRGNDGLGQASGNRHAARDEAQALAQERPTSL